MVINKNLKYFFVLAVLFNTVLFAKAQKNTPEQYISLYKNIAIKEMRKFKIPASITLAQGILESNSGNSTLARKANNHFGIKCHKSWKGKTFTHDDDRPNECFRKYKNAEQSFYDHSDFLAKGSRYAFLFELKITDYKGWARGLKKAGYATDPRYARLLISIIERYQLYKFDNGKYEDVDFKEGKSKEDYILAENVEDYEINPFGNDVQNENRINFIIAKEGDSFEDIAERYDMRTWQLYKYNEITKGVEPKAGERIYLQPKRRKADVKYKFHTVKEGETMYSISQRYGIKLKRLYRLNRLEMGTKVNVGDRLSLRKRVKKP